MNNRTRDNIKFIAELFRECVTEELIKLIKAEMKQHELCATHLPRDTFIDMFIEECLGKIHPVTMLYKLHTKVAAVDCVGINFEIDCHIDKHRWADLVKEKWIYYSAYTSETN